MIPSGTRFIGIADSVDLTEKKSAGLNAETQPYTIEDIKGHKVFTPLLTQSGGDVGDNISSGNLTIGITYTIQDSSGNPDFTIVGSPNNLEGTSFIATGTTPDWGYDAAALSFNQGAPVATVLENTIGNIWFTYDDVGVYVGNIIGGFAAGKTSVSNSLVVWNVPLIINSFAAGDGSLIAINCNSSESPYNPAELEGTILIEIRVYN